MHFVNFLIILLNNISLRSYSELEVKERYNISPTTTIHLIHDDDREFSEMTSSMNSDASNDMDLVKHHDGRISASLCLALHCLFSWNFLLQPLGPNLIRRRRL